MARTEFQKQARNLLTYRRSELRKSLQALKGQERRTDAFANVLETLPKKIRSRSIVDW